MIGTIDDRFLESSRRALRINLHLFLSYKNDNAVFLRCWICFFTSPTRASGYLRIKIVSDVYFSIFAFLTDFPSLASLYIQLRKNLFV